MKEIKVCPRGDLVEKVKFYLKELEPGCWGIDVQILDENATVADYLDSLNRFQEEKVAPCEGCSGCCWERAPLTAPDIFVYGDALFDGEPAARPVRRFIKNYGIVYAKDGLVDIIIRRGEDSACIFLDQEKQRCKHHRLRSLVCQSYVCLPLTLRAKELRSQIVNEGENELIRRYYQEFDGEEPVIHEGDNKPVNWRLYEGRGFKDKESFDQVYIKEVIDEDLFKRLLMPE